MKTVIDLIDKKNRRIIGAISGTSIDAVDLVLTEISGFGKDAQISVVASGSEDIPGDIRDFILKTSDKDTGTVEDVCKLNFAVGHLFADSINKFINKNGLSNSDIDVIGSHGQTVYHYPKDDNVSGYSVKSTLQIGDPSVIANLTGIMTIGDFRNADMALGGQGAPLAPYLDYVLFRSSDKTRLLINIGGISNITFLKKDCSIEDVIAFDTGPGNMLLDRLSKEFYNKPFDENGSQAAKGKLNQKLLDEIMRFDNYYNTKPPKSTGREFYGESFYEYIISVAQNISDEDVMRTVTDYTAYTIHYNVKEFINETPDEVIVSGGGAKNEFLMELLKQYFNDSKVTELNYNGITSGNKEAVLFALLANEALHGNPAGMPSVSGAGKSSVLGKICLA